MMFLKNFDYIALIPLITLLVLIFGALAAFFIKPHKFKNTRTSVFISIMGSVAVLILAFNVFLTSIKLETERATNNAQFTKQTIDKLWLFPNQLLTEKIHARPEFLASLYYNNLNLYKLTKDLKSTPTPSSELAEQYISIVLIQSWEDYLTLRTLEKTGDEVWLHNFLQWAQSPYLKKEFDTLKYNFASTTIELGKLLFEYAALIPIPSEDPEVYKMVVSKLLKDPKLLRIFEERSKKN